MVAKELRSGQEWRLWRGQFGPTPPFPIGPDALFVASYASAELGCFHGLGWPKPANILDLFTEFRDRTNGLPTLAGAGLVGALTHFGLDAIAADEKNQMRLLILGGGPWSRNEQEEGLDYCATDTNALERLLPAMLPRHFTYRGHCSAAETWRRRPPSNGLAYRLTCRRFNCFGSIGPIFKTILFAPLMSTAFTTDCTFKADRWAKLLAHTQIPWPLLESGNLDLSDRTFRQMAKSHSLVSPYRELRSAPFGSAAE